MAKTIDQLNTQIACVNGMSQQDKMAAKVHYLLKWAVAKGNVASYNLDTLATNTACHNFSPNKADSVDVVTAYNKAAEATATVSLDKDALAESIKCLRLKSQRTLRNMEIYLRDLIATS